MKSSRTILFPLLLPGAAALASRLQKLAGEGWNLDSMDPVGALRLTLRPSQAAEFRYFLDYCAAPTVEYRNRWEQAGWERMGLLGKYPLWRTTQTDAEIPDGGEAFLQRCQKLRGAYLACAVLFALASVLLFLGLPLALRNEAVRKAMEFLLEALVCLAVAIFLAVSSHRCGKVLNAKG